MKNIWIKYALLFIILISGVTLDLMTKDCAKEDLKDHSVTVIENFFALSYVENHAIAFGILMNIPIAIRLPLIFLLTISSTVLGFYIIWRLRYQKFRILLPFFVLLGGAYGNIVDRMQHGFVTDFFHLHYYNQYHFYVFNVADVLVNIGIILIILQWKRFQAVYDELFGDDAVIKTE